MEGALSEIRKFIYSILVIGIVAILASGIGIMNVTLATIFSRVREIGIRRALGATRADIVCQFVMEAVLLGSMGAAAGLPMGYAADVYLAPDQTYVALPQPIHCAAPTMIAV